MTSHKIYRVIKKITSSSLLLIFIAVGLKAQTPAKIPTGKKFFIQSAINYGKNNGGYWDVPGYPKDIKKGSNIQVYNFDNNHDRTFSMHFKSSDGYYEIKIGNTRNSRIDIQGANTKNGTSVKTWTRNHQDNQKFLFEHQGNGRFKIFDKNSGKVICLAGRSSKNRSNVHIWDNHNGPWMEWYLIDAQTRRAFNPRANGNKIPQPRGNVNVPEGYNVQNVEVKFFLNKYAKSPLTTKPDANGNFSFPNAQIDDNDYVAVVLADIDGLVSDHHQYHKSDNRRNVALNLTRPPQKTKLFDSKHRGNIPYRTTSKYYTNTKGEVNKEFDFFFRNLNRNTAQKQQLRELIGVSGAEATSSREIYEITRKTWEFYKNNTKSVFRKHGALTQTVKKVFDESINRTRPNGPVSYWTTIEQFINLYNKYDFIPVGNCSSVALAFSAMLRTAGVPANKMAVERFHYDFYRDHWAVIVEMNDVWYWFDPTLSHHNFPGYENLSCIPTSRTGFNYHMPFEVILVPGSKLNYVPYCGEEGVNNQIEKPAPVDPKEEAKEKLKKLF